MSPPFPRVPVRTPALLAGIYAGAKDPDSRSKKDIDYSAAVMYDNQKSQIIVKRDSADGDRRCAETGDYIFQIIRTYIVILFVILIFSILLLRICMGIVV